MIHTAFIVLSWVVGIVAVLGPIGAVAAFFFIPTVAVPIMQAVTIRFLACRACLLIVAFTLGVLGSYWVGRYDAKSECKAEKLQAELITKQTDVDNAKSAEADAKARASQIEADSNDQHNRDLAYIASLKSKPPCTFDDDDVAPRSVR